MARSTKDNHTNEIANAKKFLRKHTRLTGSGVSFNREDGKFHSFCQIETKRSFEDDVEWTEHNDSFSVRIQIENAVDVCDGKITNTLSNETLMCLFIDGISEMKELFKWKTEVFCKTLDNLHIDENEFIALVSELYLDKVKSQMEKSFPVTQRSYDKFVEKGCAIQKKKERIASTFGQEFISDLESGVLSFHDEYIKSQTNALFRLFKMMNKRITCARFVKTDEELMERASKEAIESWIPWANNEVRSILDILLSYDAGTLKTYNMNFDKSTMSVEGNIFGDTGKRLNFRTIFAGGYNIQRLHTRTIAHVFEQ